MRLMIAIDNRFERTRNGNIYSTTGCNYTFWCRYLQVFDEVIVLARIKDIETERLEKEPADGPQVSFVKLPNFLGPVEYLLKMRQIDRIVRESIDKSDAYLLHAPSIICNVLWKYLRKYNLPYAVEVVGDPWDSLAPGTMRNIFREFSRRRMSNALARQCRDSAVTSYVTEYTLQKRYPAGGKETSFSDAAIPAEFIIDDDALEKKITETQTKIQNGQPLRLCYVGSMSQLYKGPDILIEAFSICIKKGFNFEMVILGDGRFMEFLKKRVNVLGLRDRIIFLGRVSPSSEVFRQLDMSDVFVLPSRVEGLPRALIEAMARGLPCISSKVGGIPELLAEEDLLKPGDCVKLAEKIMQVAGDSDRMKLMGLRNLKKSRSFEAGLLNEKRIAFHKMIMERTLELKEIYSRARGN